MGFWKKEFDLFLDDLDNMVDFLMQPVYISKRKTSDKLRPSDEELIDKCEEEGFWKKEWNLFLKDLDSAADFLTQPVTLD